MVIVDWIVPLREIAKELRILRELYELDLSQRERPVIRSTEKPSKSDTEVSYMGVKDERPKYKRWFMPDAAPDEEDGDGLD